jgi:hypothetical protein
MVADEWKDREHPQTICLFDVDGTLTQARKFVTKEMLETLRLLRKKCVVGFVGGSDLSKQEEQLGKEGIFSSAEELLNTCALVKACYSSILCLLRMA